MKITNHINNNSNNNDSNNNNNRQNGIYYSFKKLPSAKPKKPESPGYPPAKL